MNEVVIFSVLLLVAAMFTLVISRAFCCAPPPPPSSRRCCPLPPEQLLKFISGTLTSAQLKTLSADPQIVVPAVPGRVLTFQAGQITLRPGSTPYAQTDANKTLLAYATTGPTPPDYTVLAQSDTTNGNGFYDSTTVVIATFVPVSAVMANNSGLPIYMRFQDGDAELTDGNGTLDYYIWYTETVA